MNSHVFDRQRWARMTMFEQMGNIGSEVGRSLAAKRRGDQQSMRGALYRGLDLIDVTAELWADQKSPRTTELLRAREQFVEAITTDKNDPDLENYFMQYALAARRDR
ncbi:MAG: hypothetical protein WA843_02815 [Candidatus Saccharimonadales bacterium]